MTLSCRPPAVPQPRRCRACLSQASPRLRLSWLAGLPSPSEAVPAPGARVPRCHPALRTRPALSWGGRGVGKDGDRGALLCLTSRCAPGEACAGGQLCLPSTPNLVRLIRPFSSAPARTLGRQGCNRIFLLRALPSRGLPGLWCWPREQRTPPLVLQELRPGGRWTVDKQTGSSEAEEG